MGTAHDADFRTAFTEWVEALWFDERDDANRYLEQLVDLPPEVVLAGSLSLLTTLREAFVARSLESELGVALAEHLLIGGDDPERAGLIADVVAMAGPDADPASRAAVVARRGGAAVTGAALECSSLLIQVVAERLGVIPSVVLEDL